MDFSYASDVRGTEPFYPVMEGVDSRCMQIPTTLPTLDEIIGREGITEDNAHEKIIELSNKQFDENAPGAIVGTLTTDDSGEHTYEVSDARFEVVDGVLKLRSPTLRTTKRQDAPQ